MEGASVSIVAQAELKPAPETRVAQIVQRVERPFVNAGVPREPGKRMGVCHDAADLSKRAAERMGLSTRNYQLMFLHRAFGIGELGNAFQHAINVTTVDDKQYLIDPSFCQFLDPTTGEVRQIQVQTGIQYKDNPLATSLLEKGYVELTDVTLREYLRLTNASPSKEYIEGATLEKLFTTDQSQLVIESDHTNSWLDRVLDSGVVTPH